MIILWSWWINFCYGTLDSNKNLWLVFFFGMPPRQFFLEVLHIIWMSFVFSFELIFLCRKFFQKTKSANMQFQILLPLLDAITNWAKADKILKKKKKNQFERRLNRFLCYAGHSSEMWNMQYIRSDGRAKGVIEKLKCWKEAGFVFL